MVRPSSRDHRGQGGEEGRDDARAMGANCCSDCAKNVLFALNIIDGSMAAMCAAARSVSASAALCLSLALCACLRRSLAREIVLTHRRAVWDVLGARSLIVYALIMVFDYGFGMDEWCVARAPPPAATLGRACGANRATAPDSPIPSSSSASAGTCGYRCSRLAGCSA